LLSVDQRYFLSSCGKGSLKIWDSVSKSLASNKLNAHHSKVNSIVLFSKYRLLSCSNDKTARVWQLQGSNMQKIADLEHNSPVIESVELCYKDWAATITQQGYVSVWDLFSVISAQEVKAVKLYKFESNKVAFCRSLKDYDF
jgi:WD40 repeat protein